jgi:hypothetical protein
VIRVVESTPAIVRVVEGDDLVVRIVEQPVSVVVTEVGVGLQGPPGPEGPQGPSGAAASNFTHSQATPSAVWEIVHGMGAYPGGITVIDSSGRLVEGDITYLDANTIRLDFTTAFSGTARIS